MTKLGAYFFNAGEHAPETVTRDTEILADMFSWIRLVHQGLLDPKSKKAEELMDKFYPRLHWRIYDYPNEPFDPAYHDRLEPPPRRKPRTP